MLLLAQVPEGRWARVADLEAWVTARHPHWHGGGPGGWGEPLLLGLAFQMKLVQAARGPGDARGDSPMAIRAALEDDLDTPRALRVLEDAVSGGDAGWRTAADILGLRLKA